MHIHKENIYFVPPEDPITLASAITLRFEDPNSFEKIAERSREYVFDNFDFDQYSGLWTEFVLRR